MVKTEHTHLVQQWREWADTVREDPLAPPPQSQQQALYSRKYPEMLRVIQAAQSGTAVLQARAAELKKAAQTNAVLGSIPAVPSLEALKSCQKAVGTTSAQLEELAVQRSRFEEMARENSRLKELTARSKSWVQASLQGQKPPPALRDLLLEPTDDVALEEKLDELDSLRKNFNKISKEHSQFQKRTEQLEKEVAKHAIMKDVRKHEKEEMKTLKTKVQEAERHKTELEDLRDVLRVAADKDASVAELHAQRERAAEASRQNDKLQKELEEMRQKYNDVSQENASLQETILIQDRELQQDREMLEQSAKDNKNAEKKINFLKRSAADTQRRLGAKADQLLRDPHDRSPSPITSPSSKADRRPPGRGSSFFLGHQGHALAAQLQSQNNVRPQSTQGSANDSDDEAF
eukprot:gnl/MRDRNA2_/MRDRNA2_92638_c0_seq1.p1 gnl/MRDRNA2_/MRDRNA2_92638_c0~~gnl/MRDRNA2_/MRDRNA2_92638_c0_seq1.p1  ORF type:complete len:405 (+),score=112.56 gnl/MRDRNA2_/MRDRNA2_92638_c0_seq1:63-1277(+)